jgi:RNA recognition motif-containing protein
MLPILKLKNLPPLTNRQDLEKMFSKFGNIVKATVEVDAVTGESVGRGSVQFETADSVSLAKNKFTEVASGGMQIEE